ncbi:hypothetical protein N5853_06180 [Bartonella sp. HY329]|uniref:hypothetical protein n=1 Tax=unclassified Bartonella TaxID=2645622 RepID=UPI0021C97D49|nr:MULTISPECIES: hypothetical protein [unclassified Bartonella]UXM96195.1 hypothetical protein N5853_06180 [Bartonella sp. HY329]UXN10519.1 hypothetical protein N5852_06185 [Bartonella sp. HY328]
MFNNDIKVNYEEFKKKLGEELYCCDFYFFKCPKCKTIYLYEYDEGGFFFNPDNIQEVVNDSNFKCLKCGFEFTANDKVSNGIWFGDNQDPKFHVTKKDVLSSNWEWAIIK